MQSLFFFLLLLLAPLAWAEDRPQLLCTPPEYPDLSFSRDGSTLLLYGVGGSDYFVWDVRRLKLVATQKLDYAILGAELSPNGNLLALGERPRRLAVLELPSKKRVFLHQGPAVAKGQDTGGYGVSWSPKGDMLVAWGSGFMREAGEPKCYLFRWSDKKVLATLPGTQQSTSCAWSDQGNLSVRDNSGVIRVYEPGTQNLLETVDESKLEDGSQTKLLHRLGYLDNYYDKKTGRRLFLGSSLTYTQSGRLPGEGDTSLYHDQEKTPLGKLDSVLGVRLSPDGKTLALLLKNGVMLLDVKASLTAKKLILCR